MNKTRINIDLRLAVILTIIIILVTMTILPAIIKPAEASMAEETPAVVQEIQEVQPAFPFEGVVNASAVRFRERPNTSSKIYEEMKRGSTLTVEGVEGDWYQVTRNGLQGYVKAEFVGKVNN